MILTVPVGADAGGGVTAGDGDSAGEGDSSGAGTGLLGASGLVGERAARKWRRERVRPDAEEEMRLGQVG